MSRGLKRHLEGQGNLKVMVMCIIQPNTSLILLLLVQPQRNVSAKTNPSLVMKREWHISAVSTIQYNTRNGVPPNRLGTQLTGGAATPDSITLPWGHSPPFNTPPPMPPPCLPHARIFHWKLDWMILTEYKTVSPLFADWCSWIWCTKCPYELLTHWQWSAYIWCKFCWDVQLWNSSGHARWCKWFYMFVTVHRCDM